MLILHIRTVAFIASLSTTIQNVIWFIGYILYILAYSCSYKSTYFLSNQNNENLPLHLPPYFIWYLQGSNCTTSSEWISHTRDKSTELIMVLFSVGLFLNCAVLGLSISLLVGLYTNLRLYYNILAYSIGVYVISFWDVILVAYVGLDFAPLLNSKNYFVGNTPLKNPTTSAPGDLAMSFFISVFTIIILLLSRFVFIWIFNILSVTFLLTRNKAVKSEAQGSGKATVKENNTHERAPTIEAPEKPWPPADHDNKFWGNPAPKDSALSKWHIPAPPQESPPDEVQQRWKIHRESSQLIPRNVSTVGNNQPTQIVRTNTHLSDCSEDKWKDVENHIRGSDDKWRRSEPSAVPNVRNVESFDRSSTSPKRSSFLRSIRESFRKYPPEANQPQMITEELSSKPKSIEGFSHFADPENTTGVDVKEMLGVRLRHVQRPSISNDQSDRENESSGENQATPYAISPIVDIDDDRFNTPFFPERLRPTSSNRNPGSGAVKKLVLNVPPVPPPDAPPPDAPQLKHPEHHVGFKAQMSLEEAIRTRRPLRPVNRPAIDTNC